MNPYVYSRSRRVLGGSKAEEQSPSAVSSLLSVVKSAFTSAISPAVAFAMVLFAAGSVGGMSLVAYSEISGGSEPAVMHTFAYSGHGLVLGDSTTVARVGQLVYNPNSNPYGNAIFLVGPNGLYGFTGTDVFASWSYAISQVVPENAGEVILPVVGTVPLKIASCDTAIKQILVNCGNSSSLITLPATGSGVTPRAGQLINKNGTVYLVGSSGLYGFPDLPTFQSWSFTFAQIVPGNSVELALSQIGIVPTKLASCTNPLDQITGVCGGGINIVSPVVASPTGIRAGQLINKSETVYLVSPTGLYGFPDLATFRSWGFTGSQIVLANSAEQALSQIGLVPKKISGCSAPLDQIIGSCASIVHPAIASFTVSPIAITVGQSATLFWAVSGATGLTIDNGIGGVTGLTSKVVSPTQTTSYTLTATAPSSDPDTKTVTVTVISSSVVNYDVNSDGQVNVADFQKMVNAVLGTDTTCAVKCDLNGDGQVNVADMQKMTNYFTSNGINTQVTYTSPYDINSDGAVNVADFQKLYNAVLGIDTSCGLKCDVNSDGQVNVADLQKLINYLIGVGTAPSNTPVINSAVITNGTLSVSGNFPTAGVYYVYVNGQGFAATLQSAVQITAQVGGVSGSTAIVYVLNSSYGSSNMITATVTSGLGGSGGGALSATLTGNNQSGSVTVNPGDVLNYQWSATNATSASSYYTVNKPDTCGSASVATQYPWSATTPVNSISKTVQSCQAGVTYTIVFTAPGYSQATLTVVVNPITQKITGVQGLDVTTNVVATSIVTPGKYMVLYGNFIGTGDVVTINGIQQVVTSDSANQINVSLPASLSSIAGTAASVVVTNGNSSTNAYLVTVSH